MIEGCSATDMDNTNLVYDRTHFHKYKAYRRFEDDYKGHRLAVERGLVVKDFDERALCIQAVLEAQGWVEMVEDHCLVIEELVWEFYANLHQRVGNSFLT
jgi:hypothetical protein